MKVAIALLLALSMAEFGGPAIAGAAGMTATAGFDAADVVCLAVGFATFFLVQFIASYF